MTGTSADALHCFLRARVADDEAIARIHLAMSEPGIDEAPGLCRVSSDHYEAPALEIDAERVLAECAAKRRVIEEHAPRRSGASWICGCCGEEREAPCDTMRALAAIYAGHPHFREEWRLTWSPVPTPLSGTLSPGSGHCRASSSGRWQVSPP